jgi:hypothetical protein
MNGTSGFQQDAQKGRSARPQQAKRRCVLCSVRGASERSENAAGGLFQHPAKKCSRLSPDHHTYRLLREQRHQFRTDAWHRFRTHDLIALSTGISTKREKVPDTFFMLRKRVPGPFSLLHDGIPFYVGIGIRRKTQAHFSLIRREAGDKTTGAVS